MSCLLSSALTSGWLTTSPAIRLPADDVFLAEVLWTWEIPGPSVLASSEFTDDLGTTVADVPETFGIVVPAARNEPIDGPAPGASRSFFLQSLDRRGQAPAPTADDGRSRDPTSIALLDVPAL